MSKFGLQLDVNSLRTQDEQTVHILFGNCLLWDELHAGLILIVIAHLSGSTQIQLILINEISQRHNLIEE